MKRRAILPLPALSLLLSLCSASLSMAQHEGTKSAFVWLGRGVPGLLYEPLTPGEKSHIGVFVMHAGGDYLTFHACTELSKRGYRVLCANNSSSKSGSSDSSTDRTLLDAKLGVAYLRNHAGIRKVVLFGHSGGGVLMSSYQNIAENGLQACQGPEKIGECPDSLAGLPPADGLMLIDSNWGHGAMMLFSIDPAVVGEENGQLLNPELDLFNPRNGFRPKGSTYTDQFLRGFFAAVARRNNQLIKAALDRLEVINAGKGRYGDDEPFVVPGASFLGFNNRLFSQDVRLLSHTRRAWPLLRADGSMVTQVVHSVRVPENSTSNTASLERGALTTTVRKFLNTFALKVGDDYGFDADSFRGIEWASSYSCPPSSVEGVTVPLLAMGMTGHWEFLAAETIYEHAKSADKSIAFVEGATHGYTTCTACEQHPGQFGNTLKTTYDYVDAWLSKEGRFLAPKASAEAVGP
jgi:pimeloyl-ACP methyl ester carboxylesterase